MIINHLRKKPPVAGPLGQKNRPHRLEFFHFLVRFGVIRRQLDLGSVSYVALLAAEQTYQQAAIGLAQARTNRFADTAALFQALGGSVTPAMP